MERLPTWLIVCLTGAAVTTCVAITVAPKGVPVNSDACGSVGADSTLDYWQAKRVVLGIRERGSSAIVEVDTRRWAQTDRNQKLSIAFAAYCSVMESDGRGAAQVEGSLQEDLGAVIDGKWTR